MHVVENEYKEPVEKLKQKYRQLVVKGEINLHPYIRDKDQLTGIVADPMRHHLYCTTGKLNNVFIFSTNGQYLNEINPNKPGLNPGAWISPDEKKNGLLLVDHYTNLLYKFDFETNQEIRSFNFSNVKKGGLIGPVAAMGDRIVVAERIGKNHSILHFLTQDFTYLNFMEFQSKIGNIVTSICYDEQNEQLFISSFDRNEIVCINRDNKVTIYNTFKSINMQLHLMIIKDHDLYTTIVYNSMYKIAKLSKTGDLICLFKNIDIDTPTGLTFIGEDLYVVGRGNSKITVLKN